MVFRVGFLVSPLSLRVLYIRTDITWASRMRVLDGWADGRYTDADSTVCFLFLLGIATRTSALRSVFTLGVAGRQAISIASVFRKKRENRL